jgi:hypothetical protein
VVAVLAAQILVLQMLLLAIFGAAQVARASALGSDVVICLTHDASAPAPSDNPDEHTACLDHCVLCAGVHAALPAHGVAAHAAQRVAEVLRFRAAHGAASEPREISATSARGPPLAA